MGHRKVMRVPMDFSAPLNEVWSGYVSPNWRACPSEDCCHGSTVAAEWVGQIAHLLLMLADAPSRGLHPWLAALPLVPQRKDGTVMLPSTAIRDLTGGLSRPYRSLFGHDAIDRWSATAAIIKAAGLPEEWGVCPVCHGHSMHPDDIAAAEAWEPINPPSGDGWQLWETVTEGGPITPVFASAEELAAHAAGNCSWFADMRWTEAEWLRTFLAESTEVDSLWTVNVPKDTL